MANLLLSVLTIVIALFVVASFVVLHRKRSHFAEVATVGLFVIGVTCSLMGSEKLTEPQDVWDSLLTTFQFVVLNVSAEDSPGLAYGIARIVLPLAAVGLFLSALMRRGEQWFLRLRFWRAPGLVILGSGKTGRRLASVLRSVNPQLRALVVDNAIDSSGALAFSALRIPVLDGSLTAAWVPDTLASPRVEMILVCTEDDALDYAITRQVAARLPADARAPIVVCSDAMELARSYRFDPVMSARYDSGQLQFSSSTAFDARRLFQQLPPHLIVQRSFGLNSERPCHIAVHGAGELIHMLIAQAARTLVYPKHRLKITVFVKDAAVYQRQCFERYPALNSAPGLRVDAAYGGQTPIADVDFIETTDHMDVRAWRAVHELSPIDVVYIVGEDNLSVSRTTLDLLKVVNAIGVRLDIVAVFDPEELSDASAHKAKLLKLHKDCEHQAKLHVFWRYEWDLRSLGITNASSNTTLPDQLADEIAKRVWLHYELSQKIPADLTGWTRVPEHARWWNRHPADHAAIKLKLFEDTLPNGTTVDACLTKDAIPEWLAILEHRRYICERMVDGWLRVDGEKNTKLCLNPTLVDYDKLDPDEKEKDMEAVRVQLTAALEAREARVRRSANFAVSARASAKSP